MNSTKKEQSQTPCVGVVKNDETPLKQEEERPASAMEETARVLHVLARLTLADQPVDDRLASLILNLGRLALSASSADDTTSIEGGHRDNQVNGDLWADRNEFIRPI
ncbi:hypothetical protein JHK86_036365 [Glycine max]|nr:hypothetical protein JHK86_036365 [Glycine max]